jgi:hypothetical protein
MKSYQFILSLKEKISKPIRAVQKSFDGVGAKIDMVADKLDVLGGKRINKLKKSFNSLPAFITGVFAVNKITSFGASVVDTLANFERMEAVLTNTLGSKSAAQTALTQIKDFAASTPFQVDELSESFVKLANQNFRPTLEQMRQMGDLASSVGKSYDQLTEAIIDAGQSEFERLKEFGIRAKKLSKEGKVEFTFKGNTVQIQDNQAAIQEYILSLGNLQGVQGSMAAISETTGGRLSNLADKFTNLKLTIGEQLQPVIAMAIDWTAKLIDKTKGLVLWLSENRDTVLRVVKAVAGLVARYLLLTKGLKALAAVIRVFSGGLSKLLMIFKGFIRIVGLARNAMLLLSSTFMVSPIGAIILGFTALGAAIAAVVAYWDELKGAIWAVIEPLVNLIDTIFPGFKEGLSNLAQWFKEAFEYMYSFIKPVIEGIKSLKNLLGADGLKDRAIKKAQEAGLIKPITSEDFERFREFAGQVSAFSKRRKSLTGVLSAGVASNLKAPQAQLSSVKANGSLGGKVNKGLSSVVGDSRQVKNITINIQKLVELLTVNTTTFSESPQKMKEEIQKALLTAVNDENYAT